MTKTHLRLMKSATCHQRHITVVSATADCCGLVLCVQSSYLRPFFTHTPNTLCIFVDSSESLDVSRDTVGSTLSTNINFITATKCRLFLKVFFRIIVFTYTIMSPICTMPCVNFYSFLFHLLQEKKFCC